MTALAVGAGYLVSILAHPERWALRRRVKDSCSLAEVSILAHPERWALLAGTLSSNQAANRFNPRPPRKVGATLSGWALQLQWFEFQSSPTPKGGRYVSGSDSRS